MNALFHYSLLLLLGLFVLSACRLEPEPQKIGVFADTSEGLLEISPHKTDNPYSISLSESELSQLPKVSNLNLFYVNVPEVQIAETKMMWFSSVKKEERSYDKGKFDYKLEGYGELKLEVEGVKNGMYRIRSNGLESKKTGFAVLHLRMPYGTTDRAYLVQIE